MSTFRDQNFAFPKPDYSGPQPVGQRLFPGDDTPHTFINCNLTNCELAPGSVVQGGVRSLVDTDMELGTHTVTVDGNAVATKSRRGIRLYGRITDSGYEYLPQPEDTFV